MALISGTRLGPYEISTQIGKGGMGEVYRALDPNLGRQVAIKVLPDTFARDPERLARFEREAKTLAALNHSNIAQIYGLEKADGVRALVMELVEGSTLAERIAQGPIPVNEALAIARQIAEALEAAHELGIVHRDLKPANIKVRPDGTVKVLDFGLAKAMDTAGSTGSAPGAPGHPSALSMSPTITSPALLTGAGIILGTASYMSPEQARGKAVDKRSDVWAFGCVLYEMLTGRRAFAGDDVTDVLARVLERDVDLGAIPASVPPAVHRLLRRCLAKDPRQRLSGIDAARLEIDDALTARPEIARAAPTGSRPWWERAAWARRCRWRCGGRGWCGVLHVVPCLRRLLKCASRYPSRRCASSATSRYRQTDAASRSRRRRRAAATASGFASSMPPPRGCWPVPRIPCRSPCRRPGLPTADISSLPRMEI